MRTTTKIFLISATFLVGFALTGAAFANPITGSDTVGANVTSSNGTAGNLGTATQFALGSANQGFSLSAVGSGSFAAIPIGTLVTLPAAQLDLATLASFGFTSASVGTFTPTTIASYNKTPTTLDLFLTGGFVPGTLFGPGATAPLGASENLFFTESPSGAISLSGTFAAPPAANPVPEPLPISLIGLGLIGMLILRYRRGFEQS